ncbi:MAG: TetR/AcrR family transcriptional regulator [Myxococcaceae bacterium]|nr:TetR/AcrR family transcriptional regulator [Myxococcaceae bacterium]
MRYPEEHKDAVRSRIIEEASRALRKAGIDGVSIPALMKRAGLTHGGFYAHFENRDELVAEAVRFAGSETGAGVFERASSLDEALSTYLSAQHVSSPEGGCVVAALGAEGPRQAAPVRRAFAWAARGLIDLVQQKLSPGRERARPTDEALEVTARMVGAVVLARLVDDEALARRLLSVARRT